MPSVGETVVEDKNNRNLKKKAVREGNPRKFWNLKHFEELYSWKNESKEKLLNWLHYD